MLEVYLGSVIGSLALEVVSIIAIMKKLKREGYCFNFPKYSFIESFLKWLKMILNNGVPVVNVAMAYYFIKCATNDEMVADLKEEFLDDGMIYKSEELLAREEAEKLASIKHKQVRADLDTLDYNDNNRYSNMSDAEKLAFLKKERELILGAGKIEEPFQKVKKTRKNKNI